jgi:transposase
LSEDVEKLKRYYFIDETGTNLAMTRRYALAIKGKRAHGSAPANYGKVVTVLGALSSGGNLEMMSIEGGTTGSVFLAFIERLATKLQPGDILVLDNLGAHKDQRVLSFLKEKKIEIKYIAPYSPDLNPIENAWSKLKQILRTMKARTRELLDEALALAASSISHSNFLGWLRHCGYIT